MKSPTSTREFVELLRREGELLEIAEEVDPRLELAEIQRRVVAAKGPALFFPRVRGSKFPVATNLYGSPKRIALACGGRPDKVLGEAFALARDFLPLKASSILRAVRLAPKLLKLGTRRVSRVPVMEREIRPADVGNLPQLVCWPEDGGAFMTLPLVYTEHPETGGSNLGMYRIQLFGGDACGLHIQIHRGAGFHYHEAKCRERALPAHIYAGGPPALTLATILPLPENVPELIFAGLLAGRRTTVARRDDVTPLPILAEADFCLVGEIPPRERRSEGPFGDHYGYYSLRHDYPFMRVGRIFHRKDAVYPATVVGRPPQEDHYLASFVQEFLSPFIRLVMPQVKDVWAYEESGVHALAGAIVRDRYPREALTTALRILGEGQLSLSKFLFVTDRDGDARDFRWILTTVLERMDFSRDIFVLSNISQDTLDYTGPRMNEGSKSVWLGVGEKRRELPREFRGSFSDGRFTDAQVFCPGVLAVTGEGYRAGDGAAVSLARDPAIADWPLVVLMDDARAATRTPEDFVWHVFTRCEPAGDIHTVAAETRRFHVAITPPVVLDCRMKPGYPKVLESDPGAAARAAAILGRYGF